MTFLRASRMFNAMDDLLIHEATGALIADEAWST